MTRTFHLGDVLSVTTERLVSPRHIEGIYDILNYMTGDNLFTHQLPRANRECAPSLLAQHPQLAEVQVPDSFGEDPEAAVATWLSEQVARYGEELPVEPLVEGDHTRIGPLEELGLMGVSPDRIIPVVVPDETKRPRRP
jgi:hypothetical protein